MPRLLIYEECLATHNRGPLADDALLFLDEGLAMVRAVAEDFSKLPGWQVRVPRAIELASETPAQVPWTWVETEGKFEDFLAREANVADVSLVIAPECGGLLQHRAQTVVAAGGKLLGPCPEWITLASDKTAVMARLSAIGICIPRGVCGTLRSLAEHSWNFPVVLKPNDGAGSADVQLVRDRSQLQALLHLREQPARLETLPVLWRCEEFISGQAASVAVLCGNSSQLTLRPSTQNIVFDEEGRATYRGGSLSLSPALESRAGVLAGSTIRALPPTNGYIGIDLILGEAADGSQDTVIEVNPRLTTSYLGLRAATDDSLADAMWRIAQGETVNIAWRPNIVEFTKQGQVTSRDDPSRR